MSDSPHEKALQLIGTIRNELSLGTKHYRISTNELLTTEKQILEAMMADDLCFEPVPSRRHLFDVLAKKDQN